MESKKISQLATELSPDLSDLTIIGDPTTGISKKITLSQMASLFTGTVEEYANLAAFPLVGVADTIYIALDTNIIYRWDTSLSTYVVLSPNIINSLVFSDANGFDGTITLVGSVATLSITTALTLGSVPFIGASGALTQDNSNLFFDDTNNRLGIATASPTTPLDVFGSGIIGRLNATSTNNAYLGFASNGTNKWSAGNVQSDHRFRIFSEANSAELVSLLQTGEFGIGIANPTTKFHIDGAASALIANLDANVSVAKSISFRSDNSSRINLEVSGTESGSNAGANFFIRRYSDAGSLIDTPLTLTRSTGLISLFAGLTFATDTSSDYYLQTTTSAGTGTGRRGLLLSNGSSVNLKVYTGGNQTLGAYTESASTLVIGTGYQGGGGSAEIILFHSTGIGNMFALSAANSKAYFYLPIDGTSASFSSTSTASAFIPSGATIPTNGMYLSAANTLNFATNTTNRLTISSTGNVGIGVIPDTWRADIGNVKALQFDAGSIWGFRTTGTGDFNIGQNYYYGAAGTRYRLQTGAVSSYRQNDGSHTWQIAASDSAGTSFSFTDAMTLTNGGNVGIGTSSPGEQLTLSKSTYPTVKLIETTDNASGYFQYHSDANEFRLLTITNHPLIFSTNDTERLRVTNGGDTQVAANKAIYCYGSDAKSYGFTNLADGLLSFTSVQFGVKGNFNAFSGVYTATSDVNIKKDFEDSTIGLAAIMGLKATLFRYKDDTNNESEKDLGFIAQQVKEFIPQAYQESGTFIGLKDRPIIAALVKAVQEQQVQIEELKELIKNK